MVQRPTNRGTKGLFAQINGNVYPGGKYPSVRYSYFGYPKLARNPKENEEEVSSHAKAKVSLRTS